MAKYDEFSKRMKEYESVTKGKFMRRQPVILRIDGKSFSKYTKGMKKPFDGFLMEAMQETTKYLCENIQGAKLGYTQSDEISILLTDYAKINTECYFGYGIQKVVSVVASEATMIFNKIFFEKFKELQKSNSESPEYLELLSKKLFNARFDCRGFNLPKEEVCNYFYWRQKDASKNSISMLAQSKFSSKQLHKKSGSMKQEMLFQEFGINWNNCSIPEKRGTAIIKKEIEIKPNVFRGKFIIDKEIPRFELNREYIESLI